jgi:hypothetical protein
MAAIAILVAFTNAMDNLRLTLRPDGINNLNFLDLDHELRKILTAIATKKLVQFRLLQFLLTDVE